MDAVMVALIAAIPVVLGLAGTATKYIVTLLLDAYKGQSTATVDAKDRELAAKDAVIAKQEAEIARLQGVVAELTAMRRDVRRLHELSDGIRHGLDVIRTHLERSR